MPRRGPAPKLRKKPRRAKKRKEDKKETTGIAKKKKRTTRRKAVVRETEEEPFLPARPGRGRRGKDISSPPTALAPIRKSRDPDPESDRLAEGMLNRRSLVYVPVGGGGDDKGPRIDITINNPPQSNRYNLNPSQSIKYQPGFSMSGVSYGNGPVTPKPSASARPTRSTTTTRSRGSRVAGATTGYDDGQDEVQSRACVGGQCGLSPIPESDPFGPGGDYYMGDDVDYEVTDENTVSQRRRWAQARRPKSLRVLNPPSRVSPLDVTVPASYGWVGKKAFHDLFSAVDNAWGIEAAKTQLINEHISQETTMNNNNRTPAFPARSRYSGNPSVKATRTMAIPIQPGPIWPSRSKNTLPAPPSFPALTSSIQGALTVTNLGPGGGVRPTRSNNSGVTSRLAVATAAASASGSSAQRRRQVRRRQTTRRRVAGGKRRKARSR